MPRIQFSKRTATGLGALAIGVAVAGTPSVSAVFATSLMAPTTCTVTLAPHTAGSDLPVLSTTHVPEVAGKVEVHGSFKDADKYGTELTVVGCAHTSQLAARTFGLLKAPKSDRYVAFVSTFATISKNGEIGVVNADAAAFATERMFNTALKQAKPKLTELKLPGLKGTVYTTSGTALELLATSKNGKKIKQVTKVKLAKAYIATGGYTKYPKTGPYAPQS